MSRRLRATLTALALAPVLAGAALASPATDLYEQTAAYLASLYYGYSAADPAGLADSFQPELAAACRTREPDCPAEAARPVLERLVDALGDRHSAFLTPEERGTFRRALAPAAPAATLGPRLGVTTARVPGSPDRRVLDVLPASPADAAGLRAGDRIVAVDGQPLPPADDQNNAFLTQAVASGRAVRVAVLRPDGDRPDAVRAELELTGRVLELREGVAVRREAGGVVRLRIAQWREGTAADVHAAVLEAARAGAPGIVVDLRGNTGGLSNECLLATAAFLPAPERVRESRASRARSIVRAGTVYDVDAAGNERPLLRLAAPATWAGPLAVLVDRNSASCSELFAADVQAARRGVVVGETTYGLGNTGSVLLNLADGSALQVTTQRSFRADGSPYPERVTPDVVVEDDPTRPSLLLTGRDLPLLRALAALAGR